MGPKTLIKIAMRGILRVDQVVTRLLGPWTLATKRLGRDTTMKTKNAMKMKIAGILGLAFAALPAASLLHAECTEVITMGPPAPWQCFQDQIATAVKTPPYADPFTGRSFVQEVENTDGGLQQQLETHCQSSAACVKVDGGNYYEVSDDGKVMVISGLDGTARNCSAPLPCDQIKRLAKEKQDKRQAAAAKDSPDNASQTIVNGNALGAPSAPAPQQAAVSAAAGGIINSGALARFVAAQNNNAHPASADSGAMDLAGRQSGVTPFDAQVEGTFEPLRMAVQKKLPGLINGGADALDQSDKAAAAFGPARKPRPNWQASVQSGNN